MSAITEIRRVHETRNVWELAELLRCGWRILSVLHVTTSTQPLFVLGTRSQDTEKTDGQVKRAQWMGGQAHTLRARLRRGLKGLSAGSSRGQGVHWRGIAALLRGLQQFRKGRHGGLLAQASGMLGTNSNGVKTARKEGRP